MFDIQNIKLYHITHISNLSNIIDVKELISDSLMSKYSVKNTTIGMTRIKARRKSLILSSYPDLCVGECVPFYFCPRSVMLYLINRRDSNDIAYSDGQEPIVHLVFNLAEVAMWANRANHRWAFTDSNAGSNYFNDYCSFDKLSNLDWEAIESDNWRVYRDKKQAEFLVEKSVPWHLVKQVGVYSNEYYTLANKIMLNSEHKPQIQIKPNWYY